MDWIRKRTNTVVQQYKNLVMITWIKPQPVSDNPPPTVEMSQSVLTENDLANWWKRAADYAASEAIEISEALDKTWPESRTSGKTDEADAERVP